MTVSTNIHNVTRVDAQIFRQHELGEFGVCHFIDGNGGVVSIYTTTEAAIAIAAAFNAAIAATPAEEAA